MYDVSFILPTKREYNKWAKYTVDSVFLAQEAYYKTFGIYKSFEILVCSQENINDSRVKYIKENELLGASVAINNCAKIANGKYLSLLVDDHFAGANLFCICDAMEAEVLRDRKFKIITLPAAYGAKLSLPETSPTFVHKLLKKIGCYVNIPLFVAMCFPVVSKETFESELKGYLFHPYLKSMGDLWLGYFLHANNENGIQLNTVNLFKHPWTEINQLHYEKKADEITGFETHDRNFGESYVNLYNLIANYFPGEDYINNKVPFFSKKEIFQIKKSMEGFNG